VYSREKRVEAARLEENNQQRLSRRADGKKVRGPAHVAANDALVWRSKLVLLLELYYAERINAVGSRTK
jgi:hypothetical protein